MFMRLVIDLIKTLQINKRIYNQFVLGFTIICCNITELTLDVLFVFILGQIKNKINERNYFI